MYWKEVQKQNKTSIVIQVIKKYNECINFY
jgi:hypothetical protein